MIRKLLAALLFVFMLAPTIAAADCPPLDDLPDASAAVQADDLACDADCTDAPALAPDVVDAPDCEPLDDAPTNVHPDVATVHKQAPPRPAAARTYCELEDAAPTLEGLKRLRYDRDRVNQRDVSPWSALLGRFASDRI